MSDRNSVRIQPSATAKSMRDNALRAARENDAGWDPANSQATGWRGLLGFVSNDRSGEDPIYSPGHSYTHPDGSIYAATAGNGRHSSMLLDVMNWLLGPGIFESQDRDGAQTVFGPRR